MEAKFQVQFTERVFSNYEELDYAKAFRTNTLPINVQVSEFYFKAGAMKKLPVHSEIIYRVTTPLIKACMVLAKCLSMVSCT
jgi:hypothetical protein